MAGPGDEIAAGAGDRGHLRVSHADGEQVIDALKAAFVRGVLAKDEFDLRVGQTFASRTYAELAAVTADLPARLAADQPPQPARAQGETRVLRLGVVTMAGTAVYAAVWPLAFLLPQSGPPYDHDAGVKLVMLATFFYFWFLLMFGAQMLSDWQDKRSARQLPRGPAPGTGGQSSRRLPAADPGGQLPPVDPGPRHTAEAAQRRLPRPPSPVRGHFAGGALAAGTAPASW
jgi:Domain of unknown function (DUF1707)